MTATPSPTAAGLHDAGVVTMSTGDVRVPLLPELPPPPPRLADQPYQPPAGTARLRAAIGGYATTPGGATVRPDQVLVAPGARLAILVALRALLGDRREVVLPGPHWASYPTLVAAAGGVAVPVSTPAGEPGAHLRAFRSAYRPETAVLVVNSPRNPDGAVVSTGELRELADECGERGVVLLFDQVYRGVPLADRPAPSVLDLWPDLPPHCVVVDGLAKSHALAGLRIGWALADRARLAAFTAYASHLVGGTCLAAQETAVAALRDTSTVRRLGAALRANLDRAVHELTGIPDVTCERPEGGIFLFLDLRAWSANAVEPARTDLVGWLRDAHRVAVVDGAAFGAPGRVRLSFALPEEQLRVGLARLRAALLTGRRGG